MNVAVTLNGVFNRLESDISPHRALGSDQRHQIRKKTIKISLIINCCFQKHRLLNELHMRGPPGCEHGVVAGSVGADRHLLHIPGDARDS